VITTPPSMRSVRTDGSSLGEVGGSAVIAAALHGRQALDHSRRRDGETSACASSDWAPGPEPAADPDGALESWHDVVDAPEAMTQSSPAPAPMPPSGAAPREIASLPGPRGLPLIGSLHRWEAARAHLILEQWAREHGPIYRFRLGPQPLVVISEADAMMSVLRERPHDFRRHFAVRPIFREMGIDGLFSAEGDDWRRQRPLVMRALDPAHLRRFFPVLVTATERLHARWLAAATAGAPVELRADLTRYTVDVTCSLAFGTDVATLAHDDPDPLQTHLDRIFTGISRRINSLWPSWRWFRTRADRDIERSLAVAGDAVHGFIANARAEMARRPELRAAPQNLLQALLAANEDARLSEAELHGNVMTLLLAGEDTTANTVAWALHLLSREPEVRRAARTEALEALAAEGRALGLVTNKPIGPTRAALRHFGLLDWFAAIYGGDSVAVKKPAPDMLLQALSDLGCSPDHAVMVGDSDNDILAARAAGVPSIVVTYGYSRVPVTSLGADRMADRLDAVPGLVNSLVPA